MTAIEIAEQLGQGRAPKRSGTGWMVRCPAHDDHTESLWVNDGDNGGVVLKCHAECSFENIVAASGIERNEFFAERSDREPDDMWTPKGTAIDKYPYNDETGRLRYMVMRLPNKEFIQWRPDPTAAHGRAWNLNGITRLISRLPEVLKGIEAGNTVVICEGEKDVHTLVRNGFVATCNSGGAGKFLPEFASYFKGAKVVVVPDQDPPGKAHAEQVATILHDVAAEVRIVDLPGLTGEKGRKDATDWFEAGNDRAKFIKVARAAPLWVPPQRPKSSSVSGGEATAEISPIGTGSETPLLPAGELLKQVSDLLQRFVVFQNEHQVVALALWVLHTYAFEAFETTPYLKINSATKQSGKTRLFEVLDLLVARPWSAVGATEAALFRKIAASRPTLLLDEVDTTFGKDATLTEGIRGILNAGYRRGAVVSRCVGQSSSIEVRDFEVYCPKAFAGIGDRLPDTVVDRSIPIELRRRGQDERKPERFRRPIAQRELHPVAEMIAAWSAESRSALASASPELPDELSDRQQDAWEPLLAIADLAGDEWSERARRAALSLHGSVVDQDPGILLLLHSRELRDERGTDEIATEDLLLALVNRGDDSPWARWWGEDVERGQIKRPGSQLARKLKPFGIEPKQIWVNEGDKKGNKKGYRFSDFEDAWGRYFPSKNGSSPFTPQQKARTLERRSEPISAQVPTSSKSAPEQDSSLLAFPTREDEDGADPVAPTEAPTRDFDLIVREDANPSDLIGLPKMALVRHRANVPLTPEDENALISAGVATRRVN